MSARAPICSLLVAALLGCADSDDDDGALTRDGGASPTNDGGTATRGDAEREPDLSLDTAVRLRREAEFWAEVAICGEAVEQFATVAEMAESADAVVLGHIVAASPGNTVQGDDPLDFYAEVDLRIEVGQVLRDTIDDAFDLSLILPAAVTPKALESAIQRLQTRLPRDPVVLFLRERTDLDHPLYRLVNDQGLWARTARSDLDSPIVESCHWDQRDREAFLGEDLRSVDELVALLLQ